MHIAATKTFNTLKLKQSS